MVDYYNQGKLCFAERLNQLVINYDGLVFKCTTIDRFNKENSFGFLDETGNVYWDVTKLARVSRNLQLDCCKTCRSYPDCYGPCNMHIFAGTASCYMYSLNLSHAEYLMFQYKQTRQVQKMKNKNTVDH